MFRGNPAHTGVSNARLYVGSGDGHLYALERATGRIVWRFDAGSPVHSSPALAGGLVIAATLGGRIFAVDQSAGRVRWSMQTGDTLPRHVAPAGGWDLLVSSPVVVDNMVVIGGRGERQWRATHRGSWVVGSPTAEPGRVTVGSSDGHFVHAVNPATGADIWRVETGMNVLASPLRIGDLTIIGLYYTDGAGGGVWALDAATGAVRWKLNLDASVMSSPVAADGELYVGTEDGSIVAIHETNAMIPKLAVFYDPALRKLARMEGSELARDYFRDLGYEVLDSDSLARFVSARIADGVPSAIVFAMDVAPPVVLPSVSDSVPIRRYLNSGGKVVWLGQPIGIAARDTAGNITAYDPARTGTILGMTMDGFDFDPFNAHPTAEGRRWGIDRAFRGATPLAPNTVTRALSLDELGNASAWLREYRPDRPGSGFVQLWGLGASVERLPYIRAVAEFGLLRKGT
jgi:hypothetical protein